MEEDIELLRSMYIEGREIEIHDHPFQTRITLQLAPFLQTSTSTSPLTLVICEGCVTSVKIGCQDINVGSLLLPCQIVEWVLEHLEELLVEPIIESNEASDGYHHAVVYSLDHIRNRKGYFKYLARFARESGCKCGVLVGGTREGTSGGIRMVVVGPCGDKEAPKDFMMRHRTVKVDVDSKGLLPCFAKLSQSSRFQNSANLPLHTIC